VTSETISIVILMKNGAQYLHNLVKALSRQVTQEDIEVVVVDSGSTDGSVKLLRDLCDLHGVRLELASVAPADFGHGRTRNHAIDMASGDIIAILSQDALPVSDHWLADLVRPFEDEAVAGVFGRQIARQSTRPCESLFYELTYPTQKRRIGGSGGTSFSNLSLFFSNVNGAIRRSLALTFPFRDDLVMSEDQFWGRAVLEEGYSIIYEPDAAVVHSHDYTLSQLFKRYFQSGYSLRQMGMRGSVVRGGASSNLQLLRKVFSQSPRELPYSALYLFVQGFAWLSGRYDLFPVRYRERLLRH